MHRLVSLGRAWLFGVVDAQELHLRPPPYSSGKPLR
jgi:hypothetical protein